MTKLKNLTNEKYAILINGNINIYEPSKGYRQPEHRVFLTEEDFKLIANELGYVKNK